MYAQRMSESRPVIGIVAAVERARYNAWDAPCALLQMTYVKAVQSAGGLALLVAPDPALSDDPGPILDRIDALVLAGGSDVEPASYGAAQHPKTTGTTPIRDETELVLVRGALERDMPVLGICRGMQMLNVALGGTLIQDVPEVAGYGEHCRHVGTFVDNDHMVVLEPGSLAAEAAGEQRHRIASHHHQGIDRLGDGLVITGWSEFDDLPEAIESPEHDYVLGVQWHPEADTSSPVISSLVERAVKFRSAHPPTALLRAAQRPSSLGSG